MRAPKATTESYNAKFMTADEVADYLRISKSRAYKIMRALNNELKKNGKITTSGRVCRKYLEERSGIE